VDPGSITVRECMTSDEFIKAIEAGYTGKGRIFMQNRFAIGDSLKDVYVNCFTTDSRDRVENENNRVSLWVKGFGGPDGMGGEIPTQKVSVSTHTRSSKIEKLRGKTASPEQIVKYLVNYLSGLSGS
jgi:hypothetical protein